MATAMPMVEAVVIGWVIAVFPIPHAACARSGSRADTQPSTCDRSRPPVPGLRRFVEQLAQLRRLLGGHHDGGPDRPVEGQTHPPRVAQAPNGVRLTVRGATPHRRAERLIGRVLAHRDPPLNVAHCGAVSARAVARVLIIGTTLRTLWMTTPRKRWGAVVS